MLRAYRPNTPPRRQPANTLAVDWSNPLTRGLVFLVPGTPGQTTDIAGKRTVTVTGTLGVGGVSDARLMRFDGSQALDYAAFGAELPFGGPGTVAWVQSNVTGTGYSTIAQFFPSGAPAPVVLYQSVTDANYAFTVGPSAGSAVQFSSIVGFLADNVREAFVVSSPVIGSSTPGDWSVYRNGAKLAAATTTQTFATFTGATTKLGASERAGVEPYEGMLGCFAIWNRQLSDAESMAYNANPWQLFRSERLMRFGAAAAITWISGETLTTGWTSTAATVYQAIDESVPDSASYATSPPRVATPDQPARMTFVTSRPAGNYTQQVEAKAISHATTLRIRYLDAGNASVGVSQDVALTNTLATYTFNVTTTATATQFQIEVIS